MTRSEAHKILLTRRGEMRTLARSVGYSAPHICDVLYGRRKSAKVLAAAIARATVIRSETARAGKAAKAERSVQPEQRLCA